MAKAKDHALLSALLKRLGSKGGQQRAKNLDADRRSDIAKRAAAARWARRKKRKA